MTTPGGFPEPARSRWGEPVWAPPQDPTAPPAPWAGGPPGAVVQPDSGFGAPFPGPAGAAMPVRTDLPPTAPEAYGLTYWPPGTPGWPALASPWRRLGAVLVDVALDVVTLFVGYVIWTLFTWSDGQSPGKKLLKIRVVATTTGRPATWGHMALREIVIKGFTIGLIAAVTLGIGYLVAALMIFTAFRQTLWDRIIHTVVVDETKAR